MSSRAVAVRDAGVVASTVMRRRLVFLVTALLTAGPAWLQAQDLKELARNAKYSVVALNILDAFGAELGSGSGFFVDPSGLIVTNFHVIERGRRIEAVLSNERRLEIAGVMATDEDNDLAVLKVDSGPFPALSLGDSASVEAGERVVVLGNPRGLAGTLSEGIVSNVWKDEMLPHGKRGTALQITAAISPGSSGSPVMNLDGEVVGVAVSQVLGGQNLNFAVPSQAVRELLGRVDASRPPQPLKTATTVSKGAYLRNLGLSLLFFAALYAGFRYLK